MSTILTENRRPTSPLREYAITLALLVGTLVITFFPTIVQQRSVLPTDMIDSMTQPFSQQSGPPHAFNSLITDGALQFYPLKLISGLALRHGIIAFWDHYILNGYPQYLEGMWVYNFFLFLPMRAGFLLLLLTPLLVAGFGFYLLLRDYGVRPGVSRIFALAYMLNAMFVTHLLAYFIPSSMSFAPYVLLFLHRYARSPNIRHLVVAAVSLALGFLGGNAQTAGFLVILTTIYWLSLLWSSENRIARWKPLIILLLLAGGLGMVLLLPTAELFYHVMHGGQIYSTSLGRPYGIVQRLLSIPLSLTLFLPQLAGSIRGLTLHQVVGVYTIDFEGAIGFLPLLLAVWAGICLWKKLPQIRPFAILMAAGLLIPIATPLFRFLYHRFFVVFVIGACGCGALGLEELLSNERMRASISKLLRRTSIALGAVTALIAIWTIVLNVKYDSLHAYAVRSILPRLESAAFAQGNEAWVQSRLHEALDYWRLTRPEIFVGFLLCAFGLIAMQWYLRGADRRAVWMTRFVWIITAAQLILFARSWIPMTDVQKYPLYPMTNETTLLQSMHGRYSAYFYREVLDGKQYMFVNNENIVYGIREPTGFESVTPQCFYNQLARVNSGDTVRSEVLAKFNVGMIVSGRALAPDTGTTLIMHDSLWTYRIKSPGERAFLVHHTETWPTDTAILTRLFDRTAAWPAAIFTPDQHVEAIDMKSDETDSAVITSESEEELSIRTHSSSKSYLVLTDTYYPGWCCTIDGKCAEVSRSNYSMRAIAVPAGDHRVELQFRPITYRVGGWVTCISALLAVMLVTVDIRRQKQTLSKSR